MTKIIGRQYQFGIAKETTRGTYAAASYWIPYNDLTIDEARDKVFDEQAYGIIEDSVASKTTKVYSKGSISANVSDTTFGLWLYAAFGTLTSHAVHSGESTVYDNIFNVAETTQHQSLSFSVHDPATSKDYAYTNGVLEKFEIDIELKKFLMFTASIKALTGTSESSFTPSTTSENRFVPQYLTLSIAAQLAGVTPVFTLTGTASSSSTVTGLPTTDAIKVGMTVIGPSIPSGATVATIVSQTSITLSASTTGSATSFTFGSLSASITASSTTAATGLTGITTAALQVGMTVTGTNVAAGTTIVAIVSSTAFTLSQATTGAAGIVTFGPNTIKLKSAKVSINMNIEDQEVLGSTAPADFLNKEYNVTGSFEAIWQNETDFKTQFMADNPQAILLTVANTDVTIGTAANPTLTLQMPQVYITEISRPIKVKDLVYQTAKFRAVYNTTNSAMITATLTNTVNGY